MPELFDDQTHPNESWYKRAAINAGIIGGMAFGITKMKGPFARLVESIKSQKTYRSAQQSLEKMNRDAFAVTQYELSMDRLIKSKYIDPVNPIPDIDFGLMTPTDTVKNIERTETRILEYGNKVLRKEYGSWFDRNIKTFDVAGQILDDVASVSNRNEYFSQLRHETLIDYLSREPMLRGESAPTLSYTDVVDASDPAEIYRLHEYYLDNSPEYAKLYRSRINRMSKDFWKGNPHHKIKTKASFKDYLYNGRFDSSAMAEAEIRAGVYADQPTRVKKIYGGVVPDRQGTKRYNLMDELHSDLLKRPNRWLSRTHNFKEVGNDLIDQVGKFDYTGHFKHLAETLERLKDDVSSLINDATLHLEYRGDFQYAVIGLEVEGTKGMHSIAIPISRDGHMPGKSRGATPRLDAFFVRGDEFGLNQEKAILVNKSQDLLRKITDRLDSSFANRLADDPKDAVKELRGMINREIQTLPLMTGEMRDLFKYMAVHNDQLMNLTKSMPEDYVMMKQYMRDAVVSANNIRQIVKAKRSGRKAVGIGFDLETIGFENLGPSAQVRDPRTQIHTSSISDITFTSKGNIVTNSETLVSDHVIDYMNQNNGWSNSKGSNISWLRRLMGLPADADEDLVKASFTNYIKRKAKDNPYKSISNQEYIKKVAQRLLQKVRNAVDSGSEVFLITKNGSQFDLKFLEIHAPTEYRKIMELAPHIDTQSIAYWRKYSTYGSESLRLKSLLQKILGRMGIDETIDIDQEGHASRFFDVIRKKNVRGYSLLNFAEDIEDKMKNLFNQKAHESPDVDNIGNFALLANYVSEVESGASHWSTDHLNRLGRLVAMGNKPLSPTDSEYLLKLLAGQRTKYGHVASVTGTTSNMATKGILSLLDLSMMLPFSNVQLTKDWHQLFRGTMNINLSARHRDIINKGALSSSERLALKSPLVTDYYKIAEYFVGAQDRTQQFAKHTALKTFYTSNMFAGREGMVNMSLDAARMLEVSNRTSIALDDVTFNRIPEIADSLKQYRKRVHRYALALASKREGRIGAKPTFEDYEMAGQRIATLKEYSIPARSAHAMAQGDFGRKTYQAEMAGRIVGVSIEENVIDQTADPIIRAQVEHLTTMDQLRNVTARSFGAKASMTISDNLAYGAQMHAEADFINKGYAGSAKSIFLMKAIDNLRRQTSDGGIAADEATSKLHKLARELNATWTGEQMIMHKDGPQLNFKYAKSAAERQQMARWTGNVNMSFADISNWIVRSGDAWGDEDDLARGYYRFWVGWKGSAHKTVKEGQAFLREKINAQIAKSFEKIDDADSEIGAIFKHLDPQDYNKVRDDIMQMHEFAYIPKPGGAKIFEFRTPDGKDARDLSVHNVTLGIYTTDMWAFSDINEGKAIRRGSAKVRPAIFSRIEESQTITGSTLSYIKKNRRLNYHKQYNKAAKKLQEFKDALFSRIHAGQMHLSLKEINLLLNRTSTVELGAKPARELAKLSEENIRDKLRQFIEFNDMDEIEREQHIDSIIGDLKTNKIKESVRDNMRWMSQTEVKRWEAMAAKFANYDQDEGVFRVRSPLSEGITLDFDDIMRRSDVKNPITHGDVNVLMKMFKDIYNRTNDSQKGGTGIVKKIIDEPDRRLVVLNEIVLPAMDSPTLIANNVTNSLARATDHTQLSKEILAAVRGIGNAIKTQGDIEAPHKSLSKKYAQLLLQGFNMHHEGLFEGGFVSELPGIRGQVRGSDIIMARAAAAKQRIKKMSKSLESKLDQILKSDYTTAFIARTHLENMPIRLDQYEAMHLGFDATEIRYKDYLERTIGGEAAEEVLSGRKAAPGFHSRDPMDQQGTDAILDVKIHSLDEEVLPHIGVDKNAIYTSAYMELQKEDYDADQAVIGLKNTSINNYNMTQDDYKKHFDVVLAEHNSKVQAIMNRPDVKLHNTKRPLGFTSKGNMVMGFYNSKGIFEQREVALGSPEGKQYSVDFFENFVDLARNLAIDHPDIMTPTYVKSRFNIANYNAIMKDQIGLVTNLIGRKLHHIQQSGRSIDSLTSKLLLGNLTIGLPQLNQEVMGFGKHGKEGQLAIFTKMIDGLQNPRTRDKEVDDYITSVFKNSLADMAGDTEDIYGWHPDALAKHMTEVLFDVEEARAVSMGGDKYRKTILSSLDDLAIGKRGRSFASDIVAESPDLNDSLNRVVYRSLLENGIYENIEEVIPRKTIMQDIGERISKRFNISDLTIPRKAGKYGAIGAAVFLGLNFFRPNQLSNSMNPLDAFIDLGADINGNPSRFHSDVQLARKQPIDMVNASFSREAFIRMQDKDRETDTTKRMTKNIKDLLGIEYSESYEYRSFNEPLTNTYRNSTSNIGFFSSADLQRRSNL